MQSNHNIRGGSKSTITQHLLKDKEEKEGIVSKE